MTSIANLDARSNQSNGARLNLDVQDIAFAYHPEKPVLRDVSFSVPSGRTVALLGPSGSGKTTLLQLIAGILRLDHAKGSTGTISWGGARDTLELRQQGRIGYMFQVPLLLPHLTLRRNVTLPLDACRSGQGANDHQEKASSLLRGLGLAKLEDVYPDQLSVGMRARVALARTFATEPKLLLLDEPFSSLDISWRIELYRQWRQTSEAQGTTTVLVTHDVSEAFFLASHVYVMTTRGLISRVVESDPDKPASIDLDSMRRYVRGSADLIERVQYDINADVVNSRSEALT